jgi:hypothetical protein
MTDTTTEYATNLADRSQSHAVRACRYCGSSIASMRSKS